MAKQPILFLHGLSLKQLALLPNNSLVTSKLLLLYFFIHHLKAPIYQCEGSIQTCFYVDIIV